MSKGLIMLIILITSIELFSATVYYYHDGVSNQSSVMKKVMLLK